MLAVCCLKWNNLTPSVLLASAYTSCRRINVIRIYITAWFVERKSDLHLIVLVITGKNGDKNKTKNCKVHKVFIFWGENDDAVLRSCIYNRFKEGLRFYKDPPPPIGKFLYWVGIIKHSIMTRIQKNYTNMKLTFHRQH